MVAAIISEKNTSIIRYSGAVVANMFDSIHSGTGNTDQLSVKDSGKGDSDFNDSDSDISGDGGKRNLSTFQPWAKGEFILIYFQFLKFYIFACSRIIMMRICIYIVCLKLKWLHTCPASNA